MLFHSLFFKMKLLFTKINVHDTVKVLIKITTFRVGISETPNMCQSKFHTRRALLTLHSFKNPFTIMNTPLLFTLVLTYLRMCNTYLGIVRAGWRVWLAPFRIFHQLLKVNSFCYPEGFYFAMCISKQSMYDCFLTCRRVSKTSSSTFSKFVRGVRRTDRLVVVFICVLKSFITRDTSETFVLRCCGSVT